VFFSDQASLDLKEDIYNIKAEMSDYLDPNNEELLKDFFAEAYLQVDILEQNILVIENDPVNGDAIDEIFRAAHTLKGASGTVQMMELSGFTHVIEDVLDEIRSGTIKVTGEMVDTLLASVDIIKAMLERRNSGGVYEEDISEIRNGLHSFQKVSPVKTPGKVDSTKQKIAAPTIASEQTESTGLSEYEILELREAAGKENEIFRITVFFNEDNPMNTVGGIQVFAALKGAGQVLKTEPDFEKLYEDNFYPTVVYYLAAQKSAEEIKDRIRIPDVVDETEITLLPKREAASKIEPKKAASAALNGKEQVKPAIPREVKKETLRPEPEDSEENSSEYEAADRKSKLREGGDSKKGGTSQGSILRVDSRRIDNLLNLVSETVITKAAFNQIANQFNETLGELQTAENTYSEKLKFLFESLPAYLDSIQKGESVKDVKREMLEKYGDLFTLFDSFEGKFKNTVAKFRGTSQNLGRITGELQEGVMRIRMVPISQIFSRFPRLVRDLSRSLNKKINLVIEGEDTELDKSVIEDLLDPLIHCVRNSIDHGIESPEERDAADKSEEGRVLLKASNEGNMIIIEISDDGKGIDIEGVRKKAVERGILHPSKNLSDIEAFNLIFAPGFSTAKMVTNISGRGVGLDVVKKQIEKLNGSVTVSSEKGKGTRFLIKLPLTLAIIQGLLVRVGNEKYAIPITSVIDSHRIRPSEIKLIDNYEVFNVRDDVVSLMRLNRLFRIPTEERKDYYFVVIVGSGDSRMGLIVDSLIGEEDVVIKPLRDQYTNVPGIAGANITGDGTVSLIIDVPQLLELGLKRELEERKKREATIR
jgi:two-component system chemotaxis sensor kinase CheA